ncbi:MAG TPA: SGNH/GDSL hydrolase family protein [Caldimonas sp.]|jgi:phospholipase/lecithinase/hemolysin|nr:SGNH/GDSL hydrolase family protein [Caldimonas sp.]HEX2542860.1 SGNH/GDSL hydrolase family protein [Caldimonas sp.]
MTVKMSSGCRRLVGAGLLAAAMLAASCGGGDQVETFRASRVIAFGDEMSLIVDVNNDGNGRKFTVNQTRSDTDPTLECTSNRIWIQDVARRYNLNFPQCNHGSSAAASPASRIRAGVGARTTDLAAQIDAQIAESPFRAGDLATVMIGQNDILALYAQYPGVSESALSAQAEAAGVRVGEQVNRLAAAGVKVLLATIPDTGITPFATKEKAAHTDTDRAALLTRLSNRLNARIRATILNDGRQIGLILLDEMVSTFRKFSGFEGFTNTSTAACDPTKSALTPPSSLDCSNLTLITGANPNNFLWADDFNLSAGGQREFGELATLRAENNPF